MQFTTLLALPLLLPTLQPALIAPTTYRLPTTLQSTPWITDQLVHDPRAATGCPIAPNGQPYYGPAC